MIGISCAYVKDYDISYKQKKTVCIKFGSNINIEEHVTINGFHLQWSESETLGQPC